MFAPSAPRAAPGWRAGWTRSGDLPRSGAPRQLGPEHVERIVEWAVAEPLTAAGLMARHNDAGGPQVHLNTLVDMLKEAALVWKRARDSLKKVATRPPSGARP